MTQQHRGSSEFGTMGIIFIVLKLTGEIDWSWWWVTAPFWLPIAVVAAVWAIFVIIAWVCGR